MAVIWIWLAYRNSVTWGTGPLDKWFTYFCHHCSANVAAMVRTNGFGSGRDLWSAQQAAYRSADVYAWRASAAAGCPCCGQLQPQTLGMFEATAKRLARRKLLAIPVSIALALLVMLLIGIPGMADLKHSFALVGIAISAALATAALSFGIFQSPITMPPDNPNGVWFSHDPSQGPGSWFPARPGPAPPVAQPNGALRGFSFLAASISVIAVFVGIYFYQETFRKIYVLDTAAARGAMTVRIDGAEVGRVAATGGAHDIPFDTFEVRTSSSHDVVITDTQGGTFQYHLDPKSASKGWVLAPRARQRGLCIASVTWYYGRKPPADGDPSDGLLNKEAPGDRVDLQRSFDVVFEKPPASVESKNGSETRSTLRALECAALDHDAFVPFGSGSINGP